MAVKSKNAMKCIIFSKECDILHQNLEYYKETSIGFHSAAVMQGGVMNVDLKITDDI